MYLDLPSHVKILKSQTSSIFLLLSVSIVSFCYVCYDAFWMSYELNQN